jgi:hypothetical protein
MRRWLQGVGYIVVSGSTSLSYLVHGISHLSIAISTGVLQYFDDMLMPRELFGAGSKDEVICRSCCGESRFALRWSATALGTSVLYTVARVR